MVKPLRDARYAEVWPFIPLKDFPGHGERLLPRPGRARKFWEFMYTQWLAHGIVKPKGTF